MTLDSRTEIRAEVDGNLKCGRWEQALAGLHEIWNGECSSAAASFVISRQEQLRPFLNLAPCRLSILRSFTLEPIVPVLRATAFLAGIDLTVKMSGFDVYAQQILDPSSELYSFNPDAVILALQTRDVAPKIWDSFSSLGSEQKNAELDGITRSLSQWIQVFRSRSTANLIVHNFERPMNPGLGILDSQASDGQTRVIQELNNRLQAIASENPGVYVLDYENLVRRFGERWHDERKWLVMRMPIRAENVFAMAREWLRFLHPLSGRIAKVVVTDLDNTLWGGVLGEDGMNGIRLGRDYPGAAYQALQRSLLDLHDRGILLAISSKNNKDEAMEMLNNHPEMLLRPQHFAAIHTNWNSKPESLRRIAEDLNVGLDSVAFLDDNPVERQNVRMSCPEVTVIELGTDPMEYAKTVRDCPVFERLSLSNEDRDRGAYYIQQQERKELETSAGSLEEFYYSLNQKVEISRVSHDSVPRVVQLIQKTNQFNLTTRRHSAMQISEFAADPQFDVYTARVIDRFGDNGIVGVCITRRDRDICEIDTLLLSCRVIGRTVEDAILHFLVEESRSRGISRIQGWFCPTRKNKPAESFYPSRGFQLADQTEAGTLWTLDLQERAVHCPPWIQLAGASAATNTESWAHA
jgi:FkbH-like protein